jgi:hypothetical protein
MMLLPCLQHLQGFSAPDAILEAGATCTPRNILKLAKGRERTFVAAAPAQEKPAPHLKRKSWSKSAGQTEKEANDKHALDRVRINAFKGATKDLAESQQARTKGEGRRSGGLSADDIAAKVNAELPSDVKEIAASSLRDAVRSWRRSSQRRRGCTGRSWRSGRRRMAHRRSPPCLLGTRTWGAS